MQCVVSGLESFLSWEAKQQSNVLHVSINWHVYYIFTGPFTASLFTINHFLVIKIQIQTLWLCWPVTQKHCYITRFPLHFAVADDYIFFFIKIIDPAKHILAKQLSTSHVFKEHVTGLYTLTSDQLFDSTANLQYGKTNNYAGRASPLAQLRVCLHYCTSLIFLTKWSGPTLMKWTRGLRW